MLYVAVESADHLDLEKVTRKVYLDIEVDGKSAGRCTISLRII
jgi:hypothetical protein